MTLLIIIMLRAGPGFPDRLRVVPYAFGKISDRMCKAVH